MIRRVTEDEGRWLKLIGIGVALIIGGILVALMIARARMNRSVETQLNAIRAAKLPTNRRELGEWHAPVPDNENAALVLTQAFGLMRTYTDARSNEVSQIRVPTRGKSLSPKERDLIAGYVELNADALALARKALALPKCRYPMDSSNDLVTLPYHLFELKPLVRICQLRAYLANDRKESDAAADWIDVMLGLARTLDEEPAIISQLVRIATIKLSVQTLESALAREAMSDARLVKLATTIASLRRTNSLQRALIGERATAIPYFRLSSSEIDHLAQQWAGNISPSSATPSSRGPSPFLKLTGILERDLNFYLKAMSTNIQIVGLGPPTSLALSNVNDQLVREAKSRLYILSGLSLGALSRITIREAEVLAALNVAHTALAIERFRGVHGRLPRELLEIVPDFLPQLALDPFDGALLRHKITEKGYVVYSVGLDGQDDGGAVRSSGSTAAPQDITFTVER